MRCLATIFKNDEEAYSGLCDKVWEMMPDRAREVTKIEVLEDSNTPINEAQGHIGEIPTLPLGTTKLLQGVEKSYDKGKYLLEESKNQSAESGNIRYRMRAKGDESLPWNETLGVLSDVSKKKSPNDNTSALSDSPSRAEASGLLPNQSEKSAAMVARITDNLKSLLENIPDDGLELYAGIKQYINYYNTEWHHQGINHQIPSKLYLNRVETAA